MTFADLEKKIAASAPSPAPSPNAPPSLQAVKREFRRVNPLLLTTGLVLLAVTVFWDSFDPSVHKYADQWIGQTLVCEMYMIWLAMGAWVAIDKPTWARVPIIFATVALYVFVVTHDSQFSLAPQALWLMFVRLVPPGFIGIFTNQNIKRVKVISLAGLSCLVAQIVFFYFASSALAAMGIGSVKDGFVPFTGFFSSLVWSAYYIELAFLLPYVGRNMDKFG